MAGAGRHGEGGQRRGGAEREVGQACDAPPDGLGSTYVRNPATQTLRNLTPHPQPRNLGANLETLNGERIFIALMTSDRKLEASREGLE